MNNKDNTEIINLLQVFSKSLYRTRTIARQLQNEAILCYVLPLCMFKGKIEDIYPGHTISLANSF